MSGSAFLTINHGDAELCLLASGAVWWPTQSTLLVADLHLGKETSFQKAGHACPTGSTSTTLARLRADIDRYRPTQVVILGDLIHASCSLSATMLAMLDQFWSAERGACPQRRWQLTEGNHDRSVGACFERWPWLEVQSHCILGNLLCLHDEREILLDPNSQLASRSIIAGHVHPCLRMRDNRQRLRCFHLSARSLTLPAFGEFTGSYEIRPAPGDQVFPIDRGEIARCR